MIKTISTDLTNLLNESKRRNNDIRKACELAIPLTSSSQLTSVEKSKILSPFLLSCNINNAKFANLSIPAINKLIISSNINPDDLSDLLQGLLEASHLAIDIQLKILQCLPNLMSTYKSYLIGDLLLTLLGICVNLTMNNNSTVVINTAFATLQQLFNYAFDKVSTNPDPGTNFDETKVKSIEIDNQQNITVDETSYEMFLIFQDLCRLVDKSSSVYFKQLNTIKINSILEIIENILQNHISIFNSHKELNYLVRIKLVPSLLRILNEGFMIMIRTMRILSILLNSQLSNLVIEGEIILSILNHTLLNEQEEWQKILVLEVFKNLFHNFDNLQNIFILYDNDNKKKNVIKELLSILTNYATYNPLNSQLIKHHLQLPSSVQLSKNSIPKTAILDLLDKQEPPVIPPTYTITLIFQILIEFTDGTAKFVNNLSPNSPTIESNIELINNLITVSYPDLHSLFHYTLHCSMDNENFHILIRSLQKFTHTTGLLGLNSLRDGLLTLLSKVIINIPNKINPRHLTALRALINLAISLGSTLTKSWDIIWITLQWSDYYIHGPNEFSGNTREEWLKPNLDTNVIDNAMGKLYESIEDYPVESYDSLIISIMELFKKNQDLEVENGSIKEQRQEKEKAERYEKGEEGDLSICLTNKVFFINKLYEISKVQMIKYLPLMFDKYSTFFINHGLNSGSITFKHYLITKYTEIILNLTIETSQLTDDLKYNEINQICLKGLKSLIIELSKFDENDEVLKINYILDISEIILNTLSQLIENYDHRLNDETSWELIFEIISKSFELIQNKSGTKANAIVQSSFNSLKLIMNEFIELLPTNKLKILIDNLNKFCHQDNDLNISFSSISYFFMIGDTLKSRFTQSQDEDEGSIEKLHDGEPQGREECEDCIEGIGKGIRSLDIYLLLQLVELSLDKRAQVRDGSIQTFFEILDTHGEIFNQSQWDVITSIIFKKLFNSNDLSNAELKETIKLKLDGIITIYSKFLRFLKFKDWQELINFSNTLINNLDTSIIVLDKFNELFDIQINNIEILELFYSFWINLPIEYNFTHPEQYLELLIKIVEIFPKILVKLKDADVLNSLKISRSLVMFTKILRYPIIMNKSDDIQPTSLQSSVMNNIQLISNNNDEDSVNSIILKELSNLLVYQFSVRERIENKLMNSNLKSKFKLPTFISLANKSFELIKSTWDKVKDFNIIINDGTMIKIINSLLEIITNKSTSLWIEANEFLIIVISKFLQLTKGPDTKSQDEIEIHNEIWKLIIYSIISNFKPSSISEENLNIEQYFKLISIIIPNLNKDWAIDEFISNIYDNSFLYNLNDIELELLSDSNDISVVINNLSNYDFDSSFGIMKSSEFFPYNKMKLICLQELINYTTSDTFNSPKFNYFIARLLFCVRRILDDLKLSYKVPLSAIQLTELRLLLVGLNNYLEMGRNFDLVNNAVKLLIKLSKYNIENQLVQDILLKYNNLS